MTCKFVLDTTNKGNLNWEGGKSTQTDIKCHFIKICTQKCEEKKKIDKSVALTYSLT